MCATQLLLNDGGVAAFEGALVGSIVGGILAAIFGSEVLFEGCFYVGVLAGVGHFVFRDFINRRKYVEKHYGTPWGSKQTTLTLLDEVSGKEVQQIVTVKDKLRHWLITEYDDQIDRAAPRFQLFEEAEVAGKTRPTVTEWDVGSVVAWLADDMKEPELAAAAVRKAFHDVVLSVAAFFTSQAASPALLPTVPSRSIFVAGARACGWLRAPRANSISLDGAWCD